MEQVPPCQRPIIKTLQIHPKIPPKGGSLLREYLRSFDRWLRCIMLDAKARLVVSLLFFSFPSIFPPFPVFLFEVQ